MSDLAWRTNLRANLGLWPAVAANIAALAKRDGDVYDEGALLNYLPQSPSGKTPADARSVRNTVEILALSGLAMRTSEDPPRFRLTVLGASVLGFLGVIGDKKFINDKNRPLVARPLIRGLGRVAEYRAIWSLLRAVDNRLSNEELNRAMARMKSPADVRSAAQAILASRASGKPTVIGPRLYEDAEYADPAKRSDQRKAINPLFTLIGGGWLFLSPGEGEQDEARSLEPWVQGMIDDSLADALDVSSGIELIHAEAISRASAAPISVW